MKIAEKNIRTLQAKQLGFSGDAEKCLRNYVLLVRLVKKLNWNTSTTGFHAGVQQTKQDTLVTSSF